MLSKIYTYLSVAVFGNVTFYVIVYLDCKQNYTFLIIGVIIGSDVSAEIKSNFWILPEV